MFSKKDVKFIDMRFISHKTLLVQLIKLIRYIQCALENYNGADDIVITLRIKNKYKVKLLSSINDNEQTALPYPNEIIIGE